MRMIMVALAVALISSLQAYSQSKTANQRLAEKRECISHLSGFPTESPVKTPPPYPPILDGVTIEYFASGCFGSCPSFTLRISKDFADWEGEAYVRAKGKERTRVTQHQFETFLRHWFDEKFYAMRDDYCSVTCPNGMAIIVTDIPESSITLRTPESTKRVYQCFSTTNGEPTTPKPPDAYFALEKQFIAFAKSKKWLR